MKRIEVYAMAIANIVLLIFMILVFTNRFYDVNWTIEEYTGIVRLALILWDQLTILNPIIQVIIIIILFFLYVKTPIIIGFLNFFLYTLFDLSLMVVSTQALELRIFVLVYYLFLQILLIILHVVPRKNEVNKIENIILEMQKKYSKVRIKEISEVSKSDKNIVLKIVKNMIRSRKINADLFRRTKTVAFFHEEDSII